MEELKGSLDQQIEYNPGLTTYIRKELGLSQYRLAVLIDTTPTSVHRWEHGKTTPDATSLCKILDLYAAKGGEKHELPLYKKGTEVIYLSSCIRITKTKK